MTSDSSTPKRPKAIPAYLKGQVSPVTELYTYGKEQMFVPAVIDQTGLGFTAVESAGNGRNEQSPTHYCRTYPKSRSSCLKHLFDYIFFLFCLITHRSRLQVDLLTEACVEIDLKLLHLVLDCAKLFLYACRIFFESAHRRAEHFLGLLQRDVEERIADFVSAGRRLDLSYGLQAVSVVKTYCTFSSSSASSSSVDRSSSSSFSF